MNGPRSTFRGPPTARGRAVHAAVSRPLHRPLASGGNCVVFQAVAELIEPLNVPEAHMPDSLATSAAFPRGGERASTPDAMSLIVSPVGADSDLRDALEDLKLGRHSATRDLLSRTGAHWALRTGRSQLLAMRRGGGRCLQGMAGRGAGQSARLHDVGAGTHPGGSGGLSQG